MNDKNFNGFGCVTMIMSSVALLVALIALRKWDIPLFGITSSDMDVINMLSILVTILIGWQIWQTIDAKNTVRIAEEASKKIQEFEKELERNKNIHRPFLAYTEGMRYFDAQNYSSAVNYFLSMVEMYVDYEIEFNNFMSTAIGNAITCVQKEPWNFRHRLFIDRVDNAVGRLRKLNNAVTPLDAQLSRIRKELEKICEEKIPNPYPLPGEQNVNDPDGN